MAVPDSIHKAAGLWQGKSKLNQPWLPAGKQVTESSSRLHIETDNLGKFATLTYDWHYEGKREEGTLILSGSVKSKRMEMGWVDSWHQSSGVLYLKGQEGEDGAVKARGEYSVDGKEFWGWTIELHATSDELTLRMENVPPKGEAMWAVEAVYTRA
jgi:hypothetical protein